MYSDNVYVVKIVHSYGPLVKRLRIQLIHAQLNSAFLNADNYLWSRNNNDIYICNLFTFALPTCKGHNNRVSVPLQLISNHKAFGHKLSLSPVYNFDSFRRIRFCDFVVVDFFLVFNMTKRSGDVPYHVQHGDDGKEMTKDGKMRKKEKIESPRTIMGVWPIIKC